MDRKFVSLIFFAIFLPQELMLSESEDRCCVDEVAAQHVDADFIVHYGHTCLSPQVSPLFLPSSAFTSSCTETSTQQSSTARLPVLYILTKRSIDPTHAASSLASTSKTSLDEEVSKAVVLLYDVGYAHKAGKDSSPSSVGESQLISSVLDRPRRRCTQSRIGRQISSSPLSSRQTSKPPIPLLQFSERKRTRVLIPVQLSITISRRGGERHELRS